MKRVIIIGSILFFMIIMSVVGLQFIKTSCDEMSELIYICDDMVENKDYENSIIRVDELIEYWASAEKVLVLYIRHDDISNISRELLHVKENIELKNFDEAHMLLSDMLFVIKNVYLTEIPNLGNIF